MGSSFRKINKEKWFKKSKLNYPRDYFDILVGMQCIYYNLNIKRFLEKECFRILKPGGKFIFSFFAKNHTYNNYIEKNSKGISFFNKKHPNKRLVGVKLYNPKNKRELNDKFKIFKN